MKRFALILLAALTWSANAQLTGISVETVVVHDGSVDASLDGYTTYHVYADLSSDVDFVSAVFGDAADPLMLGCTGIIFQSAGVNFNYATEVNPLFFGTYPAAAYDSWLTIGVEEANGGVNVQNTADTMAPALAAFNSGSGFVINDPIGASWFNVFPCGGATDLAECAADVPSFGGSDNRVLLAQITATGDVFGLFNLLVFPGGVQANQQVATGVTFSTNAADVFGCTNMAATNYNAAATIDDLSCILPCTATLQIDNVVTPTCNGDNDALIQVSASGTQGADYYFLGELPEGAIEEPTDFGGQNFGNFGSLQAGVYTAYVVDAAGCTDSIVVDVPVTEDVTVTAELTQGISCHNGSDAVLSVVETAGGNGEYQYYISNNPTVFTTQTEWTGLSSGQTLTIYAIDGNQCIGSSTPIQISNPTAINVGLQNDNPATAIVDASCANVEDGLIYLVAYGGVAPTTIQFSVDGVNYGPSPLAVSGGTYTVTAQNANGCVGFMENEVVVEAQNENCGCLDSLACNFDPLAQVDDGSCLLDCPGCTVSIACNYDPAATVDDGSCEFYCPGCTDPEACNYDEGAIQDNGSCEFPEALGWCDCDGTPIDALGVCGGDCPADEDADGLCDDADDCVGVYDDCGVCNGPGAVYDCGCSDIPTGDCDCEGSSYDQCGVCGGDGSSCVGCTYTVACNYDPDATILDVSLCEFGSCTGCTLQSACNYNPTLSEDDGSCEWCSCLIEQTSSSTGQGTGEYPLTVEIYPAVQEGLTTYRFYVNMSDPTDRMSAVYGNDDAGLYINTPDGAYNSGFNSSWSASGINPAFLTTFPEMADDTYATIGLTGPASTSGIADAADPTIVEDSAQPITPYFQTDGATALESNTLTGASWYVLNTAGNGFPDENLQVLILQVTTSGDVSGTLNYQVFPLGVGSDAAYMNESFELTPLGNLLEGCTDDIAVNYCPSAQVDDGSCFYEYFGCLDEQACNYSATATIGDEALCVYIQPGACDCDGNVLDECGVCGGDGIPEGQCDCEGNVLDAVGVCGGDCEWDANSNGICDVDEVGGPEACGWGTVWNSDSAACVLAVPPFLGEFGDYNTLNPCYYDLDLSGTVGAGDLINFLSTYNLVTGCSWTPE